MQEVRIDKKVIIPDLFILQTDGYKPSHWKMYPKNLTQMVSYLESRGGDFDKVMFIGLQYYILRYLVGKVVTREDIEFADKFLADYFGDSTIFNRAGWEYILNEHDGYLPLIIRAIPEGTITKKHVVQMTIETTDPHCAWLVNYTETLLMKIWYPCTVGTQSFFLREFVDKILDKTGDPSLALFKVHCFGYRGIAAEEQSYLAGAHLVSFRGSDTLGGVRAMQMYYDGGNCANSIAATEHSIMCVHSKNKNDLNAFEKILDAFPNGLLACVSDTYDIFRACEWAGTILKEKILARNGVLILRPDSGDPEKIVPKCLNILWKYFGGIVNEKGYKVLHPKIRIIQGDGMNYKSIQSLYNCLEKMGWSADNLAVGSGGGLIQIMNRDTLKFAIKACGALVGNEWIDIYKDPITDPGKTSKFGIHKTVLRNGEIFSAPITYDAPGTTDLLHTVFENGYMVRKYTLDDVKENVQQTKNLR